MILPRSVFTGDLQDPPEVIPELFERWKAGVQVVWAARQRREGERATTVGFSRLYYWVMRNVVGMKEMAATGADFFLAGGGRRVLQLQREQREHLGAAHLDGLPPGDHRLRQGGSAARSLGLDAQEELKLAVDSVTSFSYVPIRFMSYLGFVVSIAGFLYAGLVVVNFMRGNPIEGWSSLIIVVLLIGGVQMVMMGVLGEYLWRALDESRRRPRYLIEATTGDGSLRPSPF
jgi:polyisoprenyl-phosphate glycosyltransferase